MNQSRHPVFLAAAIAAASLSACGGGGGGGAGATTSNNPSPSTMGTLAVSLTDAPACGFDAVNITVNKVRVHQSATASDTDSGWTDIALNPARKINLLSLTNGALDALGQTALGAGHYSQLRLVLDANSSSALANSVLVTGANTELALDSPSAIQSGIKLVNEFDVAAGQRVDLVLDFDACKSVLAKGNGKYALKPVLKVVPSALNGISGFVAITELNNHVRVSAQQNGTIIAATTPNPSTGEFLLTRLPLGNYDVVISADKRTTTVVATVPVASASAITPVSTGGAPIPLGASSAGSISGVVLLTPASSSDTAYVTAKQSFVAGPLITVQYQGVDMASGVYTLAGLPTTAPQYAPYSSTLPLQFTAASGVVPGVGKYLLEASATGYATKSLPSVDISQSNQSNVDFSLFP